MMSSREEVVGSQLMDTEMAQTSLVSEYTASKAPSPSVSGGAQFKWPEEAIELLVNLAASKKSGGQIAIAINRRFGVNITRNSVIGKAHRMRKRGYRDLLLSGVSRPYGNTNGRAKPKRNGGAVMSAVLSELKVTTGPPKWRDKTPLNNMIVCCPSPIHIMAVTNDQCKWPLWPDKCSYSEKLCCGNDAPHGVYCTAHAQLAYKPAYGRRAA